MLPDPFLSGAWASLAWPDPRETRPGHGYDSKERLQGL